MYDVNEGLLKKGIDCYDKGEVKRAQMLLNEVIESDDKQPDAFYYLGNIFHQKGEIGKAIKAFQKVLKLKPEHTDAAVALSILYNDIGKYEEASAIFQKANERVKVSGGVDGPRDSHVNKKFADKHFELAELYLSYNRYDEALFEYNKCIGLDPDNYGARIKIAKVYAKKGFLTKSLDELKTLINESPTYHPARVALGILYYGNGHIIEAQDEWKKVLAKDPFHQEASMYLKLSNTASETSVSPL